MRPFTQQHYFSLSIPPNPPLATTHNIRLEKSIDVITRGRGALAAPPNPRHVVSTCKFHTPFRSTRRVNATRRSPSYPHPTKHNSITCFSSNNNIIMSNNNNNDDAKRPYRILRGGNSLVSSYTVNNARALATDKVNKNIGTRHAVVLLRSYIGSYYSYSIPKH